MRGRVARRGIGHRRPAANAPARSRGARHSRWMVLRVAAVEPVLGDLTGQDVDVVVNAADSSLPGVAPAAGAAVVVRRRSAGT